MSFSNYRKETSERSDSVNWVKRSLITNTDFYYESIEGCNENVHNMVTHMLERARVDFDGNMDSEAIVLQNIVALETPNRLIRKINFAKAFNVPLYYVLYCDEIEQVWVYDIIDVTQIIFVQQHVNYQDFSNWIASIKGWISRKTYRENPDLPNFDRILRKCGTAWPTNIDCFFTDRNNQPIGIIEFQNASKTTVENHCNNDYFWCKMVTYNYGHPVYHDDIRRWQSQEILRLQSGLRLFILTWSQSSPDYILKELDRVIFPYFPQGDWATIDSYKEALHKYVESGHNRTVGQKILDYSSYGLTFEGTQMVEIIYNPRLDYNKKTFPCLYYKYKHLVKGKPDSLISNFNSLVNHD